MPIHGGLTPCALRMGGGTPPLKRIIESLASQLGTAYDADDTDGIVYLELLAEARCIQAVWSQNQRMANQWQGPKMTDFLARWERIYRLPVFPSDTLPMRRARVAAAQARNGRADAPAIVALCQTLLNDAFVSIVNTPSSTAVVWTPTGWPMGSHGSPNWYSSVAHVAIETVQPASMTDSEYYDRKGAVVAALDAILPAWVTFSVFRDGVDGIGFFLDRVHNLDNDRFA